MRKSTKSGITFSEPPARGAFDWKAIAADLKAHPMEWAKIGENVSVGVPNAMWVGKNRHIHPALGFEVTTANNSRRKPRTCTLFIRWNPGQVDDLAQSIAKQRESK